MKKLVLLMGIFGLLACGCGGTTSNSDGGGTGGAPAGNGGNGGSTGTAGRGATGSGGRAGGAGGVGGQLAGIPSACTSCATSMCSTQLVACVGNTACSACVQNDFQSCITNGNAQYQAVCNCAKGPCTACDPYCP